MSVKTTSSLSHTCAFVRASKRACTSIGVVREYAVVLVRCVQLSRYPGLRSLIRSVRRARDEAQDLIHALTRIRARMSLLNPRLRVALCWLDHNKRAAVVGPGRLRERWMCMRARTRARVLARTFVSTCVSARTCAKDSEGMGRTTVSGPCGKSAAL